MTQEVLKLDSPVSVKPKRAKKEKAPAGPKPPRKQSDVQLVIARLVARMQPWAWGREGRLAKTLLEKYGREFMMWCPPPEGYKVTTLMWFFDDLGKNYLSDQLVEYAKQNGSQCLQQKEEIVLAETKIGEDIQITKKPKTLKDFLNYGKETRTPSSPERPVEESSPSTVG